MAGYTTKTVQRIVLFRFPTNGQAKELPHRMGTPLEGRPENLTSSLPTQGRVTSVTR